MKFLCLCHYDLDKFSRLGPAEFEELGRICAPLDEALKASGKASLVGSLGTPEQFRVLRADGDGVTSEDGPYFETREPFGAFFIVEAESMDEAAELARLHPTTHTSHLMGGGIEIRPIEQLEEIGPKASS